MFYNHDPAERGQRKLKYGFFFFISQTLQNSKNKLLMGNNTFTVLKAKLKVPVSISHLCVLSYHCGVKSQI